jgi:AraC-like DNA-binding protein
MRFFDFEFFERRNTDMNKIISFVLLCALLLMCFSGCTNSNINEDDNTTDSGGNSTLDGTEDNKEPENEDENNKVELNDELNDLFAKLQEDSEKTEKISFSIQYQDLHYELKASDKYNNEKWRDPNLSLSSLSEVLESNRTYVGEAFKRNTGMTFIEYLTKHRIDYIVARTKDDPKADIHQLFNHVGYRQRSTAWRNFQKITGMTPTEFVNNLK